MQLDNYTEPLSYFQIGGIILQLPHRTRNLEADYCLVMKAFTANHS